METTPIYGVKGREGQSLPLLGAEWSAMLRHTIDEGRRLGIGADVTLGSGWPYGGPQVSANRIAAIDRQGIPWRNFHEINFVNMDYKPFDASVWRPRPAGLLRTPELWAMAPRR